ncbi:hypothetical protein [Kineococcus rhizosphaerae]|uniref:hypothetical protein n=1 Tax=Kineococcus rhizosphaerae TaxID=559628 RepID=UPI000D0779CE|nr:hypothetical protein [Kineococcus rhizosphaerae]
MQRGADQDWRDPDGYAEERKAMRGPWRVHVDERDGQVVGEVLDLPGLTATAVSRKALECTLRDELALHFGVRYTGSWEAPDFIWD